MRIRLIFFEISVACILSMLLWGEDSEDMSERVQKGDPDHWRYDKRWLLRLLVWWTRWAWNLSLLSSSSKQIYLQEWELHPRVYFINEISWWCMLYSQTVNEIDLRLLRWKWWAWECSLSQCLWCMSLYLYMILLIGIGEAKKKRYYRKIRGHKERLRDDEESIGEFEGECDESQVKLLVVQSLQVP